MIMKKFILIFGFILIYAGLGAQEPYKHCLDEGMVKWSSIEFVMDGGWFSTEYMAYGDTIINGIVYKKMYRGYFFDFEETDVNWKNELSLSGYSEYWGLGMYIRESEDASHLYILNTRTNKEYLFFDLNLQVGDEFQFTDMWNGNYRTHTVDSVYIDDGLKHVRFDMTEWFPDIDCAYRYQLTFIEGIGPNEWYPWMNNGIINCFQNQSLFYKNKLVSFPCGHFLHSGGAIESISPNKEYTVQINENEIAICFSTKSDVQIAIYDLMGKMYYHTEFLNRTKLIIPTAFFPQGIYLLEIFNKNRNTMDVEKIIL